MTLRTLDKERLLPTPGPRDSMMHAQAFQLVVQAGVVQRAFYLRCAYGTDEVKPEKIEAELEDVVRRAGALLAMLRSERAA